MSKVLYFLGGVTVGCAVTYFIVSKQAEKRIEEEVAAFKEQYSAKAVHISQNQPFAHPKDVVDELNQRKANMMSYDKISKGEGYNHNLFTNPPNPKDIHNGIDEGEDFEEEYEKTIDTTPPKEGLSDPYTISPDQFVNEQPFFDKITLEYYDDGILCEEISDEIIDDISGTIGMESLNKFGEYEEDVVYIRNERISTDYEVIRQHRPFAIIPGDDS